MSKTLTDLRAFAASAANAGDDLGCAIAYVAMGHTRGELPKHLRDALKASRHRLIRKAGAIRLVAAMR